MPFPAAISEGSGTSTISMRLGAVIWAANNGEGSCFFFFLHKLATGTDAFDRQAS
jgi:hypothetical protein